MNSDEQTLVEAAKTDQQAFGQLFDLYYPRISNYVVHRVSDVAVAQDITSVVFFKAWQNLPKFEWRGLPFSAWLYRIASNEVNSHFRRSKRQPASLDQLFDETGFELPAGTTLEQDLIAYQDSLDRHQQFVAVQRLILELPVKYQEVLSLRFFEKQPIKDIALIINKNESTVKSLLKRGTERVVRNFPRQGAL